MDGADTRSRLPHFYDFAEIGRRQPFLSFLMPKVPILACALIYSKLFDLRNFGIVDSEKK